MSKIGGSPLGPGLGGHKSCVKLNFKKLKKSRQGPKIRLIFNTHRVVGGGGGVREGTGARGATNGRGVCQIRHCRRGRQRFAT